MSTLHWRGDAPAVAQESRATPANVEVGDVFRLTINGKSVAYTAAAATVADVTAGLTAAWNVSKISEHAEVTATDFGSYVALRANRPGVPFTLSATTTDGGGTNNQTLLVSTPVASAGPHDWSTPANWSTGTLPASGDDVYLEHSATPILYGLDQSAVALNSLTIAQSFTGTVGLPRTRAAGYVEYRPQYLTIRVTRVTIGAGEGAGSPRIKLDTLDGQTTLDLLNTGFASDSTTEAVHWKGMHAENTIHVTKGSLAIAPLAGESAQLASLCVGYRNNQAGDAIVRCGAGLQLSTLDQTGGLVTLASDIAIARLSGGELQISAGAIDTLHLDGGTLRYESTGAIGTAHIGERGTLDFSRNLRARTVGACHLYSGARLLDPFKTTTFSSGLHLVHANLSAISLDLGPNRTLTVS
jgi:hypothetical protein